MYYTVEFVDVFTLAFCEAVMLHPKSLICVLLIISFLGSTLIVLVKTGSYDHLPSGSHPLPKPGMNKRVQKVTLEPILLSNSTEITHDFKVKNSTNDKLIFKEPKTSCGCSKVAISNLQLMPGESSVVSVSVNLTKGSNGLKEVTASVVSTTGETWLFQLGIPIVSRFVVPQRIVLDAQKALEDTESFASKSFSIIVHAQTKEGLNRQPPRYSLPGNGLNVSILGHTDSIMHLKQKNYFSREYDVKVKLKDFTPKRLRLMWELGDLSDVTYVDVIKPSIVSISPKRVIIKESNFGPIDFTLKFADEGFSAKILRIPDHLSQIEADDQVLLNSQTFAFLIDPDKHFEPVEKVVFQILKDGKPILEKNALIVSLCKNKKERTNNVSISN